MTRMSRIKFQTEGNGKEWIWIPRQSVVAFDGSRDRRSAQSPTHQGACFPQAEKQSAATTVKRDG